MLDLILTIGGLGELAQASPLSAFDMPFGGSLSILAQLGGLSEKVKQIILVFRLVSILLAVTGISFGGYLIAQGNIGQGITAIIGAGIIGLSGLIATTLFDVTDPTSGGFEIGIDL